MYQRTIWAAGKEGNTLVTADRLNNIEKGIADGDLTNPLSAATTFVNGTFLAKTQRGAANGVASLGADGKVPSAQIPTSAATPNLSGTYANRPAIASVADGTTYSCTDLPEQYIASGGVWVVIASGGNELGYAAITAQTVAAGVNPVTVVGLASTFKVGVRPIRITVCADVANELANSRSWIDILLDGTKVYSIIVPSPSSASMWVTGTGGVRVGGLTPNTTHTVSVQIRSDTAGGTVHITGTTGSPGNLQIVTC